MLIWQKGCKGTVKVRIIGNSSYVFVKREKLQTIIGKTYKAHNTRKDCQELSIAYGWIVGLKAIALNQSTGKKNIEFYFNDESKTYKAHNTRKDCQELSIAYGWIVGLKAIALNQSTGKKNIEFYFNDESTWKHEPDVILTEWNELFDEVIKVVKSYKKGKEA